MWKTLLIATLLTMTAAASGAATLVTEFTGTIFDSSDPTGVFLGSAADPLANNEQAFTLSFTFDTAKGTRDTRVLCCGFTDVLGAGRHLGYLGFSDSLGPSTLTIAGVSRTIKGEELAWALRNEDYFNLNASDSEQRVDLNGNLFQEYHQFYVNLDDSRLVLPTDLEDPFSLNMGTRRFLNYVGGFRFFGRTCDILGACNDFMNTEGFFRFNSLTVTVDGHTGPDLTAATVPLPAAAWLLLTALVGMGGLGRRRKRVEEWRH